MGNKITITGRRRPAIDERYTRPQGLYPHRDVDHRKLRKLILDSKLAPCYPGAEEPAAELEECPICFLHYPSLNRSKCCSKGICTECFLQMKSPHVSRPTQCPFCKTPNYAVEYRGAKTMEEKGVEQAEEQKVIEAKIRMRQQELRDEEDRVHRRDDDIRQGRVALLPPAATTSSTQTFPVIMSRSDTDGTTVLDAVTIGGRELRTRGTIARPVGTPQPGIFSPAGLFATPAVAVDPDSLWFRGGQRNEATDLAGGMRQPMLSSSILPSMRIPPSHAMAGNGSTRPGVGAVVGNIAGIQGGGSTYTRFNRDDEFDLDLEDIMVMEAIWLSIQEQGPQRHPENDPESVAPESMTSFLSQVIARNQDFRIGESELLTGPLVRSVDSGEPPLRRNSVTGGLAGAIAALAERQVAGGAEYGSSSQTVHTDEQPEESHGDQSMVQGLETGGGGIQPALLHPEASGFSPSLGIVGSSNNLDSFSNCTSNGLQNPATDRDGEMDPGSHALSIHEIDHHEVHGGRAGISQPVTSETDFGVIAGSSEGLVPSMRHPVISDNHTSDQGVHASSQNTVVSSCLSTRVLQEAPDPCPPQTEANEPGQDMVPETFEEQMMLAMALSLAEVQARDGRGDEREDLSQANPEQEAVGMSG